MIDQTVYLKTVLPEFKGVGVTATELEGHLGLSTGYLSKVKTGRRTLEPDNIKKLEDYYKEKVPQKKVDTTPLVIIKESIPAPSIVCKVVPNNKVIEIKQTETFKSSPGKLQIPKGLSTAEQIQWRINHAQ